MAEPRRCPSCGYTQADKRLHLDHHLCPRDKESRTRSAQPQPPVKFEPLTADEAWQDLLDKDDRTAPAEYPEMCLITHAELAAYMAARCPGEGHD